MKLNGGFRTSVGYKDPKHRTSVQNENTFLDLTIQQTKLLNRDIPLILIRSFNTNEDTKINTRRTNISCEKSILLIKADTQGLIKNPYCLKQKMHLTQRKTQKLGTQGHGDVDASFYNSGLLNTLLGEGKGCISVSNIDNLGVKVELYILNHLMNPANGKPCELIMEITIKSYLM